ncbi:hypothetical protein O7614_24665 [Micromonospora sp. WMMD961]|uniref:hypothetical protein n=1 Tax=Micromonospora sp. WMMD961 TaxID=3016100 RepID=UPI0024180F38|nr:hypothetical protein [Micromonospora sp. WMMD961]MDG4782860.1 hypothetical protein [Micromonospora sp. WMMD961]
MEMNHEAEVLVAEIQRYGLDHDLVISVEVREVDGQSDVTDIWLDLHAEVGPEVLVSHVASDPHCRISVQDFTFEEVEGQHVPEFVYQAFQGERTLAIEERPLSRWRVLRLHVSGIEYVATVRLNRDPLDEWEVARL